MLSHLALWTPARLQVLAELQLNGLHFCGVGLQGVLVLLLSLQSFIQGALLFTDLKKKRGLTERFLTLAFSIMTPLSSLPSPCGPPAGSAARGCAGSRGELQKTPTKVMGA